MVCQSPSSTHRVCQDPVRTPERPPQLFGTSFARTLFPGPSGLHASRAAQALSGIPASLCVALPCLDCSLILLPEESHILTDKMKHRITQNLTKTPLDLQPPCWFRLAFAASLPSHGSAAAMLVPFSLCDFPPLTWFCSRHVGSVSPHMVRALWLCEG